jgi:TonB family protein
MNRCEGLILSYLANSLWQVPLLYAAAWLAARVLRSFGPVMEHRILVTALLLQVLLPACSSVSIASMPNLFRWMHPQQTTGTAHVSVTIGTGFIDGTLQLPTLLESMAALLYVCICLYFSARFLWRSAALRRIRREAMLLPHNSNLARLWKDFTEANGHNNVTLAVSSRVFSPATIGLFRKLILLPASMTADLSEEDFQTILAHEFAHLRRHDFAWNLVYELLTLPVSYHPIFWLTRQAVIETREMVCDQAAAASVGSTAYAYSLLRLASLLLTSAPLRATHAIGIFDANTFERRLMKLTQKRKEIHGLKRALVITTCLAFGAATCGTALALRMRVDKPSAADDHPPAAGKGPVKVEAAVMAGNVESRVTPVYPPDAKKKKIQGSVVLHALIGKDGKIDNLTVISGPKELQGSAIDAVSKWVYKPYLLNGDPTEVETTITVTYTFG